MRLCRSGPAATLSRLRDVPGELVDAPLELLQPFAPYLADDELLLLVAVLVLLGVVGIVTERQLLVQRRGGRRSCGVPCWTGPAEALEARKRA